MTAAAKAIESMVMKALVCKKIYMDSKKDGKELCIAKAKHPMRTSSGKVCTAICMLVVQMRNVSSIGNSLKRVRTPNIEYLIKSLTGE